MSRLICNHCGSMSGVRVEKVDALSAFAFVAWCVDCWDNKEATARATFGMTEQEALESYWYGDEETDGE